MNNQVFSLPISLGQYDIILKGSSISYTLKRSNKAKLIWLNIKRQTGLTVTVPYSYNLEDLPDYLNKNASWILRNFKKYCIDTPPTKIPAVQPVNTISYLGKRLKVMQNRSGCGTNALTIENNNLIVSLHTSGTNLSSQELEQWLKSQAVKLINEKAAKFSKWMGLRYNRIVIRDQKSRWGSCSCLKNLNFNWRLIMAPESVLDYVIIHELCHLKVMGHSKSFWEQVSHYCPGWHEYRDWLDSHCLDFKAQLKF
jgi:predicted metal-dependent hydrolase